MKNISSSPRKIIEIILILVLIFPAISFSQNFIIDNHSVTGVFEAKGKTKSELFSALNRWITLHYKSANSVIQLNDPESGTIIVKGVNSVVYTNADKILYPNNKNISSTSESFFNHTLEINIKDDRFRIIFTVIDVVQESYPELKSAYFNSLNFINLNDSAIGVYNKSVEYYLKKGMVGKEKRGKYLAASKPMFADICSTLVSNIKIFISSTQTINQEDKW